MKLLKYAGVATAGIAAFVALKDPIKDVFMMTKNGIHTLVKKTKEPRTV